MKFKDLLKELREKAGLTQEGLAERAGLPIGTVRNHEQGQRLPSFPHAAKLARALGVSLDLFTTCDEFSAEGVGTQTPSATRAVGKRK